MKKLFLTATFILFSLILPVFSVYAVYVNGYYRSNGTYVNGYERTAPDGNPYNNYSYPGNYNPNTGNITGGSQDAYLDRYYNKSSGSTYSSDYNSYNSYPTTPTCPINSYYDGVSSCKCDYGYVVSGGSCVSANSLCQNQLGYAASYDSLANTCKCNYGYIIGASGQCVSASIFCSDAIGLMSEYNSLSKRCECMIGYEFDGSSCVYKKTSYTNLPEYSTSQYSCPSNAHLSANDQTKCDCDYGYQISSSRDSCVPKVAKTNDQSCADTYGVNSNWDGTKTSNGLLNCGCKAGYQFNTTKTTCVSIITVSCPSNSTLVGQNCVCDSGTTWRDNQCISYTSDCQLVYGNNVVGTLGPNNNSSCDCSGGYQWNTTKTACLETLSISTNSNPSASVVNNIPRKATPSDFDVPVSDLINFEDTQILVSPANFRKCPSINCSVIRYYAGGLRLKILGQYKKGEWYQVEGIGDTGNNEKIKGWIYKSLFKPILLDTKSTKTEKTLSTTTSPKENASVFKRVRTVFSNLIKI